MTEILSSSTLFKKETNKMLMHCAIVHYNALVGIISIRKRSKEVVLPMCKTCTDQGKEVIRRLPKKNLISVRI